jgi:hypothetical protein
MCTSHGGLARNCKLQTGLTLQCECRATVVVCQDMAFESKQDIHTQMQLFSIMRARV